MPALWLKVSIAFALALLAVYFLPANDGGTTPPADTLLLVAVTIALVTTVAIWLGLRLDLGFPTAVIVYTVGWNVLVVLAKFALGPHGFYEVNQEVDIDASLTTLDDPFGAFLGGALIFALYAGVYWLIYRGFRGGEGSRTPVLVGSLVVGAILLSAASGTLVLLLLPLFLAAGGIEYLEFVFTSSVSLVVGLMLAGAVTLAILAFRSAAERARIVGDAILVSLFWVGLAFLAIYQVLWVVYILVLTSIWPLKTVTPK